MLAHGALMLTVLIILGIIYLLIGVLLATSLATLDAGTSGDWSPIMWLLIVIGWLPYIIKVLVKMFGPLFLALLLYPFRRR